MAQCHDIESYKRVHLTSPDLLLYVGILLMTLLPYLKRGDLTEPVNA